VPLIAADEATAIATEVAPSGDARGVRM